MLHMAGHFFRFKKFPDQRERPYHVAQGTGLDWTVNDASVLRAGGVQAKKVRVMGHDHSRLAPSVCKVAFVRYAE